MNELVTIVIPCYMQAQFLQEAIDSVRAQTYPHWECVIVNDASPDHTAAVADAAAAADSRIRVINKPHNEGLPFARNTGIRTANGKFILPLDADDAITSDYLEASVTEFQKNPQLKLVYTDVQCIGSRNDIVERLDWDMEKICHMNLLHPTGLFKKEDFDKTQGYRPNIFGYEDWDFWIQLINNPNESFRINRPLFICRIKEQSMITELLTDLEKERAIRKKIYEYNKKKFRQHAPALSYHYELSAEYKDYLYILNQRLKNIIKRISL